MNNNTILYRGVSSKNLSLGSQYINLTTSFEFACEYGDIILVYELQSKNISEESISNRKSRVEDYDAIMEQKNIDGYRWKISDT